MAEKRQVVMDETAFKQLMEVVDFVHMLMRMRGEGLKISMFGASFSLPSLPQSINVQSGDDLLIGRISGTNTASSSTNVAAYTWVEAVQNADGSLSDKSGGRSSSGTSNLAIEPNGFKGLLATGNNYVLLHESKAAGTKAYTIIREVLGVTTGGTSIAGSGSNALSGTWAYKTTSSATITLPVRYYDNTDNDGNFYYFTRDITIDANGNWTAISAETRATLLQSGTNCAS